jgi:two-component system sensor histidine kinase PilS (NtrC family)
MNEPAATLPPPLSTDLAWRVLTLVNLFRLLVPIALTTLFIGLAPSPVGQVHPAMFVGTSTAYFLFAAGFISSIKQRWPSAEIQALVHVCVDVFAITLITYASGGMNSGLATLLVLPVGAAALVTSQRFSLTLAAGGALALLAQQLLTSLAGAADMGDLTAAGIIGAVMFVVNFAIGRLGNAIRTSEALVKQRDIDVANLAELNTFIVQHLRESIMVVDANDRILLVNESAGELLRRGAVPPNTLLGEVSPRLLYLLDTWRRKKDSWQLQTSSLLSADGTSSIEPHFVALNQSGPGPTLVFLEDTSAVSERVQQTKLAALGRLSASIAHEIRNPVGAMSHAAQLLSESSSLTTQERRLTDIITTNGGRVSTIINNVMQLSRRDSTHQERIQLNAWLTKFLSEFRETLQLEERVIRLLPDEEDVEVRMDPTHLHQVLWNLCENATKYGKPEGHSPIEIRTGRVAGAKRPLLEIADRGPGIPSPECERIFEPFFTVGKGGTGLGLFIARELAQCNRAVLHYEQRSGGGSVFRVVFADPQRWES